MIINLGVNHDFISLAYTIFALASKRWAVLDDYTEELHDLKMKRKAILSYWLPTLDVKAREAFEFVRIRT